MHFQKKFRTLFNNTILQKMHSYLSALLCLCLFGCAPSNRTVITGGTNPTVKITGERHIISEIDVHKIIKAVKAIPHINHNIRSIKVISAKEVEVTTGIVQGLLHGGGDIVIIRKNEDQWKWHGDIFTDGWYA
jgi:hypothetical protein